MSQVSKHHNNHCVCLHVCLQKLLQAQIQSLISLKITVWLNTIFVLCWVVSLSLHILQALGIIFWFAQYSFYLFIPLTVPHLSSGVNKNHVSLQRFFCHYQINLPGLVVKEHETLLRHHFISSRMYMAGAILLIVRDPASAPRFFEWPELSCSKVLVLTMDLFHLGRKWHVPFGNLPNQNGLHYFLPLFKGLK